MDGTADAEGFIIVERVLEIFFEVRNQCCSVYCISVSFHGNVEY